MERLEKYDVRCNDDENGRSWGRKLEEIEWLLRYGDEQEIIKHRFSIAHIVNLYRQNNEDS